MNDIKAAALRWLGLVLIVLGACSGAWTCGYSQGHAHATSAP